MKSINFQTLDFLKTKVLMKKFYSFFSTLSFFRVESPLATGHPVEEKFWNMIQQVFEFACH